MIPPVSTNTSRIVRILRETSKRNEKNTNHEERMALHLGILPSLPFPLAGRLLSPSRLYRGSLTVGMEPPITMKVLDLFCGMGGWSIGFHREGFKCVGLDEVDVGYPYEFWHSPIEELRGGEYQDMGFDVVVASPPCTEFSPVTKLSAAKGQRSQPDPNGPKGMGLVKEGLRVIELVKPRFWCLENVYGSRQHIEPLLGKPRVEAKPFLLWGKFPEVLWPDRDHSKSFHQELHYRPPYLTKTKK